MMVSESPVQQQSVSNQPVSKKADKPLKTLRQNPFTTYRDPQTGRWIVVKPSMA